MNKKNMRRIHILVTAQTAKNLEKLAAMAGYFEIGRVVDKMTRENNDHLKELLNAIGVLAETSLLFYRAVIQTGASEEEAKFLTQALIRASMTSNPTQESEGER